MENGRFAILSLLICCSGQFVIGRSGTMDDWIRLTNALFSNYTKEIYPVFNFSEALTVDTSMMLISILDLDELSGVITVNAVLISKWTDFRLKWNPSDYGGIRDIFVNYSTVWKPSLFVQTTAENLEPIGSSQFHVRINYTGECLELPGKIIRSTCQMDMSRFPMDSHLCEIIIRQWGMYIDEVRLIHTATTIQMSLFSHNAEWDIVSTSVTEDTYRDSPTNALIFSLYVRRKSRFFMISLTIPIFILCFLNPFVFLLPASSGERISYTITMFLSLAVYMTIMGDNIPRVSDNMAGMTYFLLFALIYSGTLILLTILTMRCEWINDVTGFPSWLRTASVYWCHPKVLQRNAGKRRENEAKDESNLEENVIYQLHKDDVMKFIDVSLFAVCFALISIGTILFLSFYYI